jgi:hypothetical protein
MKKLTRSTDNIKKLSAKIALATANLKEMRLRLKNLKVLAKAKPEKIAPKKKAKKVAIKTKKATLVKSKTAPKRVLVKSPKKKTRGRPNKKK